MTAERLAGPGEAKRLDDLGGRFQRLRRKLEDIEAVARHFDDGREDHVLVQHLEQFSCEVHREMFAIAHEAALLRASGEGQLRIKAEMLREYCVEEDDDIVQTLGASLCRDLLADQSA